MSMFAEMQRRFRLVLGPLLCSVALNASAQSAATGFFVTDDGYFVTNFHVVEGGNSFAVRDADGGVFEAKFVRADRANDLALLKVEGKRFRGLPIVSSSTVKKGDGVFTIGFPQVLLQGFEAKLTDGLISSFSGIRGEPNTFQISVPVQPGNSGGPLLSRGGAVVGVVVGKLSPLSTIQSGSLPENVNYAIKSNYLLEFLRTEPAVARNLKSVHAINGGFSAVVERVEPSVVLVVAGSDKVASTQPKTSANPQPKTPANPPVNTQKGSEPLLESGYDQWLKENADAIAQADRSMGMRASDASKIARLKGCTPIKFIGLQDASSFVWSCSSGGRLTVHCAETSGNRCTER